GRPRRRGGPAERGAGGRPDRRVRHPRLPARAGARGGRLPPHPARPAAAGQLDLNGKVAYNAQNVIGVMDYHYLSSSGKRVFRGFQESNLARASAPVTVGGVARRVLSLGE